MGWWPFVPKHRGCPDPRLDISIDVLEGSPGVRVNPPRCAPGVTQLVTQFSRSAEHAWAPRGPEPRTYGLRESSGPAGRRRVEAWAGVVRHPTVVSACAPHQAP